VERLRPWADPGGQDPETRLRRVARLRGSGGGRRLRVRHPQRPTAVQAAHGSGAERGIEELRAAGKPVNAIRKELGIAHATAWDYVRALAPARPPRGEP
jgi:hypothetical protein